MLLTVYVTVQLNPKQTKLVVSCTVVLLLVKYLCEYSLFKLIL